MRVFVGCEEVAGILNGISEGFKALGHEVTSLVEYPPTFYDFEYSYNLSLLSRLWDRNKIKNQLLSKIYGGTDKVLKWVYLHTILKNLIKEHDLFIFIWKTLLPGQKDLEIIKTQGKKIISIYVGSDIRYAPAYEQEFNVDVEHWDDAYQGNLNKKMKMLRMGEYYSDLILSVPDQSGLALRPYNHMYLPFSPKEITHNIPDNQVLKVLHIPSNNSIKGSKVIIETIQKLKNEGIPLELITLSGISNKTVLEQLTKADILVDELYLHGPGVLSLEAMSSGCAVATRYLEKYKEVFSPPVCHIDETSIYKSLKRLFTNREYRLTLAKKGRQFVEQNNDPGVIATNMINMVDSNQTNFDYYPDFYLSEFSLSEVEYISSENLELSKNVILKYGIEEAKLTVRAAEKGLIPKI